MLEVYTYNAGKGDCVRIRFSDTHNIFIDTGVSRFGNELSSIWKGILSLGETLDVLILTHVDNDHIGGVLSLLRSGHQCPFQEVWMNHDGSGFLGDALLSTKENSELYGRLVEQGMKIRPVVEGDTLLVENAKIHILNPGAEERGNTLIKDTLLAGHTDFGISLSNLADKPIIGPDRSVTNKDSIVFIFEWAGKRLLFTGDAWAKDVCKASGKFDLVKLPHHGSARNISDDYPKSFESHNFIICTDGRVHPDKQTIAKLEKWYDEISIFSPVAWWNQEYFVNGDNTHNIHYNKKEGLAITW